MACTCPRGDVPQHVAAAVDTRLRDGHGPAGVVTSDTLLENLDADSLSTMLVIEEPLEWVRAWVEDSGYGRLLGVQVLALSGERARLELGFRHDISNGDTALHGGVTASMVTLAAGAVTRAALGIDTGPFHTAAVQVGYLSAALNEGIAAEARLLRRGKELAYVDVEVTNDSGKTVAKGLVMVHGRLGAEAIPTRVAAADHGETDPGPMGPFIASVPFHATLGLAAEHMAGGRSRIVMPHTPANSDTAGGVHEGAVLALLDTTGAMAAWAKTGPGRFKASTPGLQAAILQAPPAGNLVGYGRVLHHDRELLFCEIEACRTTDRQLVACGTVTYRIVTPELAR